MMYKSVEPFTDIELQSKTKVIFGIINICLVFNWRSNIKWTELRYSVTTIDQLRQWSAYAISDLGRVSLILGYLIKIEWYNYKPVHSQSDEPKWHRRRNWRLNGCFLNIVTDNHVLSHGKKIKIILMGFFVYFYRNLNYGPNIHIRMRLLTSNSILSRIWINLIYVNTVSCLSFWYGTKADVHIN